MLHMGLVCWQATPKVPLHYLVFRGKNEKMMKPRVASELTGIRVVLHLHAPKFIHAFSAQYKASASVCCVFIIRCACWAAFFPQLFLSSFERDAVVDIMQFHSHLSLLQHAFQHSFSCGQRILSVSPADWDFWDIQALAMLVQTIMS